MASYEYSAAYTPAAPLCSVYLGAGGADATIGPFPALLDTGADFSVLPLSVLRQIGAPSIGHGRARSLWQASRTVTVYAVSLRIESLHLRALRVLADDEGEEVVLGRQVLNRLRLLLDGPAGLLDITD
jgi:predicted aspartyl protease